MHPAVDDEEGLAVAFLAVDDPGQIDARFADDPAAKLDRELRLGKDFRAIGERLGKGRAHRLDVERLLAMEIGDPETAAEIDQGRSGLGLLSQGLGELQAGLLGLDLGGCLERLRTGEDVEAPPFAAAIDDPPHCPRHSRRIDAEGFGAAAHAHPGAFDLEIGIDPDSEP